MVQLCPFHKNGLSKLLIISLVKIKNDTIATNKKINTEKFIFFSFLENNETINNDLKRGAEVV